MIEYTKATSPSQLFSFNYLNLYDEMTKTDEPFDLENYHNPLMTITSQQTGKSKTFVNLASYASKERFILLITLLVASSANENLSGGYVYLGTTDYPLGFYDVIIYQNSSDTNLDPTGLNVIWNGLLNLQHNNSNVLPVEYTEYTTNDADTDSVYITF